ncbi:MAG: hypothetical protein AVDCRST_MAG95-3615 [uncultured Adhaeribacter sp.]|uniref:Uncharacterized protein n=1 Tax=uncultured Adhaeribacter sp. TaxID=448109 RepID=A0A6J4JR98_9BACT|nr:MAG: hypothetical protein AVDCRST_MAG95-3615 [uncultured Adhaeribacter sp.]
METEKMLYKRQRSFMICNIVYGTSRLNNLSYKMPAQYPILHLRLSSKSKTN